MSLMGRFATNEGQNMFFFFIFVSACFCRQTFIEQSLHNITMLVGDDFRFVHGHSFF